MVSPYAGWADINSFLDHDNPNYAVDGTISLANGLSATATDGQASDFFPSYWSSSLRQYVNYDGHNGYDYGISYQPILATAAGKIAYAGWNGASEYSGYGQMVLINHQNGYVTLYGHLSRLDVHQGQRIEAGQQIGMSGSTGRSSGPHLHFSVFHNCQVTDPYGWTGSNSDPLREFNHERSSYLWLPGEEPLVLNPPPSWPKFPLGLKVTVKKVVRSRLRAYLHHHARTVPPADRLLLLNLPRAQAESRGVSPAVALARTESAVNQEEAAVVPFLRDLQAQGLVQTYQTVPAAGAVWVRGTATAEQLEGLPGVASLSGGKPSDVTAAQLGLSQSILVQIGAQRAPSLWPVSFRSALNLARPTPVFTAGHALVSGYGLAGERVSITVHRGAASVGTAGTVADPDNGRFVATIHDASGSPVAARVGDSLQIASGGRASQVAVLPFRLRVRAHTVTGRAQPGAAIALAVLGSDGHLEWKGSGRAHPDGSIHVHAGRRFSPGDLAVGDVVDAGGNQEAATASVPGMVMTVGSSTIRGWAVGASPHLRLLRHGRLVLSRNLYPTSDGAYRVELQSRGRLLRLMPGDVLRVGSRWHERVVRIPTLGLKVSVKSGEAVVSATAGTTLTLSTQTADGKTRSRILRTDSTGRAAAPLPSGFNRSRDLVVAGLRTTAGDIIEVWNQLRTVTIREGTSHLTGRSAPGEALRIRLWDHGNRLIGGGVAVADRVGSFRATMLDGSSLPVRIRGGMKVTIQDSAGSRSLRVPAVKIWKAGAYIHIQSNAGGRARIFLTLESTPGKTLVRAVRSNRTKKTLVQLPINSDGQLISRVRLSLNLDLGATVDNVLVLRGGSRGATTKKGQ